MPDHDIELSRLITATDGAVRVFRRVRLPFVPFPGLILQFDDGRASHEIIRVAWLVAESRFVCNLDDYEESRDLAEIEADWSRRGWTVEKLTRD